MEKNIYIHNLIWYITFCCTIPKLTKKYIKTFTKNITSLKFDMNANTNEKPQQRSPNFVRSNQESPVANSLGINTNDTTKRKK